jgi:hypothetical protein
MMGWSGYHPHLGMSIRVDAHGGEREERGERLYQEFMCALDDAIIAVVRNPKFADPDAIQIWYYGGDDEFITNESSPVPAADVAEPPGGLAFI